MSKTVQAGYIGNRAGTVVVPTTELTKRVIQTVRQEYTAGQWNPSASYAWIPGTFYDFTPKRADSIIHYNMRLPISRVGGSTHGIANFYFYANNILAYSWEETMNHYENGSTYMFSVPSWGTSTGRIGMQQRSHVNDNHELRHYTTEYWNGGGSNQNCPGQLIIEEMAI